MSKHNSDIYERIILEKKKRKLNNSQLGEVIGKSGDAFRMSLKRKSLSSLEIEKLERLFGYDQKQVQDVQVNEPLNIFQTKNGSQYEELPNGKYLLTVPLVPVRAQARYVYEFTDAEFVSNLTKVSFIVDKVGVGVYRAFEIQNDSMDDDSKRSIPAGSYVCGRELKHEHWKSKLRINQYQDWIIVHRDTVLCKQITGHDVEKGIITCHSLNDSPEYQDFDINLNEVKQLFNIISVQSMR